MSPAALTPIDSPFDPRLFERRCEAYLQFRRDQDEAKSAADEIKAWLLAEVQRHGLVPTNAEKSRRVETAEFVATVTTGTTVEVNDQKVVELELLLSQARSSARFPQLFTRRTEYTLVQGADLVIGQKWPARYAEQIRALYSVCFKPKAKTPALDVQPRSVVDAKAAAKAAKTPRAGKVAA